MRLFFPFSILLIFYGCFYAADWHSYRCVVNTKIQAGEFVSHITSTVVCLKKEDKVWYRISQIEPDDQRFISIIRNNKRQTFFPNTGITVTASDVDIRNILFLDSTSISLDELKVTKAVQQGKYLMPKKLEYRSLDNNLIVTSDYKAYRINEVIPEETFNLGNAK